MAARCRRADGSALSLAMSGGRRTEGSVGWHLRPAKPSDVPRVAAIEAESFSDPWSASSFRSLVSGGLVWFRVAIDDGTGEVIGYILVWFAADEAELANIAVTPGMRGRRIGAALLDQALAAAEERGTARMFLEVRDSNERARALYASRGFEEVGRRRGYYRRPVEDALILRRTSNNAPEVAEDVTQSK